LAEKADLDVHHKKKDTACKKKREVNVGKKWKAGMQIGPPAKRMALAVRDENIWEVPAVNEESEDDSEADRAEPEVPESVQLGVVESLDADVEVRQLRYTSRHQNDVKPKHGKWGLVIGSAIDDLVNADTRGIHCRREPVMVYFANDKISE
jgi:hypothetical protein